MKFFFLLTLFTLSASAGILTERDCTSVDMRERNPKIKNNPAMKEHFSIPRNQDSIGWCYAFAAADLISAEMDTPISSLHASLIYNQHHESGLMSRVIADRTHEYGLDRGTKKFFETYEGGDFTSSLRVIQGHRKICPESLLPFDQHKGKTTMELIYEMERIKQNNQNQLFPHTLMCNELNQTLPDFGFTKSDMSKIASLLVQDNINSALEALAEMQCKNKQLDIPFFKTKTLATPLKGTLLEKKNFLANINMMVNIGKPVGIRYKAQDISLAHGNHINLITGRRWNNGRCEYKFRNSWGQTCEGLFPGIDCIRSEGSFWVDEDFLLEKTSSATYLHK